MNHIFTLTHYCFLLLSCLQLTAQQSKFDTSKSLSPYFQVKSDSVSTDQLPLKNTKAKVNISGMIADVTIEQTYRNEGETPLEAIYTFPASTSAAVYAMEMRIGVRIIKATIKEKEEARKEYEKAKKEGKRASLLEQKRPNVFTMNVANVMPNDDIVVTLKYTEFLTPTDGTYKFVYPTVVGPRYASPQEKQAGKSDFENPPHQQEGEVSCFDFDIDVEINSPVPIQKIICNTHSIRAGCPNSRNAKIYLDESETNPGNRDFVLKYQLPGEQINSGVMLYEHEDENFFLMMLEPPKRVEAKDIPPREYIFINDVSGSMSGYPMDVSKDIMKDLVNNLRPEDSFNVLVFAGSSGWLADTSLTASKHNIDYAINFIDYQSGGGSTEILNALEKAISLPRQQPELSRTFVVVTDGYVSVEKETFDLIRNNNDKANTFVFGIGSSVNRFLLEGIARAGMGEPFIVLDRSETTEKAKKFREYISNPVLTQIDIDFGNFDVYDVEPISVPDVFAQRPIVVYGKYKGTPKGTIKVSGFSGKKRWTEKINVSKNKVSEGNVALRYLWARKSIQRLSDYAKADYQINNKQAITDLGLKYNLLTKHTSFIAVEEKIVNKNGVQTIEQVVPLPKDVSNNALAFDLAIEEDTEMLHLFSPRGNVQKMVASPSIPMNKATGKPTFKYMKEHELKNYLSKELINSCPISKQLKSIKIKVDEKGNLIKIDFLGNEVLELNKQCIENIVATWDFKQLYLINREIELIFN